MVTQTKTRKNNSKQKDQEKKTTPEENFAREWLLSCDLNVMLAVMLISTYQLGDYGIQFLCDEVLDVYQEKIQKMLTNIGGQKLSHEQAIIVGMVTETCIWRNHY